MEEPIHKSEDNHKSENKIKLNYKSLGLIVGLEIHQQLEGKKLFCKCPTEIIDTEPDLKIKRRLRASAGEMGEIDEAAKHEQLKEKHFVYHFYKKANCLVELDEEPPHNVNKEAMEITLIIAKLLNAKPVDEIQFMRKTVVDGSNVSGFQRTALAAMDGLITTNEGKIGIPTICVEEESAKIVQKTHEFDVYNLSRLGIPLIEIATSPDIHSPQQAKECAEKLGMILRSTGKVKRGIGTIRQDINISIAGGSRVEIKGAQELKLIPTLVEYECLRQQKIITLKGKLKCKECDEINERTNKSNKSDIKKLILALDDVFKSTKCNFISKAISAKHEKQGDNLGYPKENAVYGFKLTGLKGILGTELQPNKRIGTELSEFAKVNAGITGIIHSDEHLEKYSFTNDEITAVRRILELAPKDCFVMIVADYKRCEKAYCAILKRLAQLNNGVQSEVRAANPDGTTTFMRPIPSAARMYPETDVPPFLVTKEYFGRLKTPELIEEKVSRIQEYGLSKDLADLLVKKHKLELFETFVDKFKNLKPSFIAEIILPKLLEAKRTHNLSDGEINRIDDIKLEEVLEKLDDGEINKQAVEEIFVSIARTGNVDFTKFKTVNTTSSANDIEKEIKQIVEKNKELAFGALMGIIMNKYRGKVDGKLISEILRKYIKT
ncbi:Glu-tRNA(Gln) amidotransferase subunit GatE [Candidatus Woesearchaeota archaeon]|nr:Glu-tRNA(Gln) amidotransferase subunit GatE [Candidatus Woesearchaeota archaeon]